MDLMLLAVSFFTVVVTSAVGYFIIQRLFPSHNRELEITKAFKEEDFEKVIALSEGREEARSSFNVYSFTAQAYSSEGRYTEAIQWWEMALKKLTLSNSDKVFVEVAIGDEYTHLEDLKTAELYYRMAVSIDPEHEKANHHLAQNLYSQEQYEQARKILRNILKKNPSIIDSRRLYAECLASMGLFSRAIRHYGLLERIHENVPTYNYALTLKNIKVWGKAHEVYTYLLENTEDSLAHEIIINDLVEICIYMKKYHDCLGLIDKYLPTIETPEIIFELRYMRANVFYLRGDQMIALREYSELATENPTYKDLQSTLEKNAEWLSYPFLFNYFTSQESIFETLVTRIAPIGSELIRRNHQYYICLKEPNAYVFYRDMNAMTNAVLLEIEDIIGQYCPTFESIEVWSLNGLEAYRAITGQKHQLIPRTEEEFLIQVNIIVSQMDYLDGADPLNFVEGHRQVDEIVLKTEEEINETVDNILNNTPEFLEDTFISKALD